MLFRRRVFPVLTTPRLTLRAANSHDLTAYHRILSQPELSANSELPATPDLKSSRRFLHKISRLHANGSGVAWMIETQDTQTLLGSIRLNQIDTKSHSALVAYELCPQYWNKGYTTESLAAVVLYAHNAGKLNRLEAWTTHDNPSSERVLIKCGFQYEGLLRQKVYFQEQYQDIKVFGHLADTH
jgi:ribosomal-protein-alanine N-acetyltransferase